MYPESFFKSPDVTVKSGKCFVLMPFAKKFAAVYEAIRKAIESAPLNFQCVRADDIQGGGHIMESVLRGIAESEIIIADLTEMNPNVFYELGVTHTVKKVNKVIMLIQNVESVPFDLTAFRTVPYEQSEAGLRKLRKDLVKAVKSSAQTYYVFTVTQKKANAIEEYHFTDKILGKGSALYDFTVRVEYFGTNALKFDIIVTRYVFGDDPKEVSRSPYGLNTGQSIVIPQINWELRLEKVLNKSATFRLTQL